MQESSRFDHTLSTLNTLVSTRLPYPIIVVDGENRVIDIPADEIDVASLPVPPAGYEIARVDVVVRLRKIDS